MSGVSAANTGAAIEAVNQVMMNATQQTMQAAEKMMKVTVEMSMSQEIGKGEGFDAVA